MSYKLITQCRICAGTDLVPWLDLGSQPLANRLLSSLEEFVPHYPLKVVRCTYCSLSQLTAVVDPGKMFTNYPFRAGVSETWRRHCAELVDSLPRAYTHDPGGLIVDIGSNDGTLLDEFSKRGMKTLGVDPAAMLPVLAGEIRPHNLINDYWSKKTAQYIVDDPYYGPASIITATNVLAHVDDVHDFMEGVNIALADDGLFVVEVPLVQDLIEQAAFDTVYHEHLSYFTGWALNRLLLDHGFFIKDRWWLSIHGGSIRVIASKKRNNKERVWDPNVDYAGFQGKVDKIKKTWDSANLFTVDPICGYGASAKAAVFLNALGIKKELVPIVFDDNMDKAEKYIPGVGSVIHYAPDYGQYLSTRKYLFILSWNVADDIKRRARGLGFKGKFICRQVTEFRVEE